MRLICPNCGAQYAVADDVIPAAGRDVQCSNCAHTWFETPGASSDDTAPAPRKSAAPSTAASGPYGGSIADAFKDDDPAVAPAPQAPKRAVDPSVADILREEAAREAEIRRANAPSPMEDQTDMALEAPAAVQRPNSEAVRKAAESAAASTGAVVASAGTRRGEMLPDIEEINSSLQSDDERGNNSQRGDPEKTGRSGFRRGFFLVLLLIAVLVAIYVQADAIKAGAPGVAGAVDSYVETVDAGRIWLDTNVRGLIGGGATSE